MDGESGRGRCGLHQKVCTVQRIIKKIAESYGVTYPTVRLRLDKLIEKIEAQEQEETAPYVKLIKKLALEDRIDFEAAKLLISTYRKEKNEETK